ncbi:MAG: putative lipid II flippase FtsW [Candidatus Omnitrophota bacterium]|nr:putative lipid II flippase FtsW [Candidatus Omnitrophota bacterium]
MIILLVSILLMIGVVMIYSSSAVYAYRTYGNSLYFVLRHLAYVAVGLFAAVFCMMPPAKKIADNSRNIMLCALFLLLMVIIPGVGKVAGGARRWISFFGINIQPSELAKFALIIYLADFTSRKRYLIENFRNGVLPPLFITGITAGLVFLEPDMGTCISILFVGVVLLFVSGIRLKHLRTIAVWSLPALCTAIIIAPYRIKRIIIVFNPWKDPKGAGFQLVQSFIALGSGGFWGTGLGMSKQKLFYLPASHTDFIFSIIGEETGFVGAAFVLALFTGLVWVSIRIAFRLRNVFASRVVLGISIIIAFEVMVNVGVSTGVLPTKGLPLPFISYGGSSLVSHLAAIGLILNMAREVE